MMLRAALVLVAASAAAAVACSAPAPTPEAALAATAVLAETPSAAGRAPATTPRPTSRAGADAPPLEPDATPAPQPAAEPSPTARLQSQQDGPPGEPIRPDATAASVAATPPAPIPRETITPAEQCDPNRALPAFGPHMPGGFSAFRAPLPPAPLWNPPGPKRVGLQAGHWLVEQTPAELERLQPGAVGGGKQEWEVNLEIARRARDLLEADGFQVDLLPATVPIRYQAHVFVSIHADGDAVGALRGFKVARPGFSSVPEADDLLVDALNSAYGAATGLPRDDEHISLRMRFYYAFNARRYCHAVAPGVPQAIVETGFLTSPADRQMLLGDPGAPARGIADAVRTFLAGLP